VPVSVGPEMAFRSHSSAADANFSVMIVPLGLVSERLDDGSSRRSCEAHHPKIETTVLTVRQFEGCVSISEIRRVIQGLKREVDFWNR
jgi:hypothetical protein